MRDYFCIVNMLGVPAREIVAIRAIGDAAAMAALDGVVLAWPGFETVVLYEGERPIAVRCNPHLGFPSNPLIVDVAA